MKSFNIAPPVVQAVMECVLNALGKKNISWSGAKVFLASKEFKTGSWMDSDEVLSNESVKWIIRHLRCSGVLDVATRSVTAGIRPNASLARPLLPRSLSGSNTSSPSMTTSPNTHTRANKQSQRPRQRCQTLMLSDKRHTTSGNRPRTRRSRKRRSDRAVSAAAVPW